jgi:hypothetical protein
LNIAGFESLQVLPRDACAVVNLGQFDAEAGTRIPEHLAGLGRHK